MKHVDGGEKKQNLGVQNDGELCRAGVHFFVTHATFFF